MLEVIPLLLFLTICLLLMFGYPVALTLAGTSLLFAAGGIIAGVFDPSYLTALPNRLFGTLSNVTLVAVPLFVMMGVTLEKSRIAEQLLHNMASLFGRRPGGLAFSVVLVGALLAASTGIVGATVVTMAVLSLPSMLQRGYHPGLASGVIAATGTLGQIIPPSIALVLLGDILSSAYQRAQLSMNIFTPDTVSVGDLFVGALIPGLLLVLFYSLYIGLLCRIKPSVAPASTVSSINWRALLASIAPPLLLIVLVLGSILAGVATPTEAAAVGAFGATLLALAKGQLNRQQIREIADSTLKITCMVFLILIGAAVFSLVFRGFGGEELIEQFFQDMPGGVIGATFVVMLVIFLLGFILDFIEISFVVVPIVAPILLTMGLDPIWLGIMIAVNLQTSFLTPPFGFALFYLRGVAPPELKTGAIYRGVMPFVLIQLLLLACLAIWPELATWLPAQLRK